MDSLRNIFAIPDLRKPPIRVEAVGTALHGRPSWDQFDDLTTMALRDAAAQMWSRTDMKPSDVQVAEMYDGFSFITMAWLEAMASTTWLKSSPARSASASPSAAEAICTLPIKLITSL